jgi:hypothetical protein
VTSHQDVLSNGRHLRFASSIAAAAARDGARPAAPGCPVAHLHAGIAPTEGAENLWKELRAVHAATRELLERFSLADRELQRLQSAIEQDADPSGASHYLAGVCLFQRQEYGAAVQQLEVRA